MSIKSEYPWQKGPDWGKPQGVVAVLDIDGHHFEVHKRPYAYPAHYVEAGRPIKTSRYRLIVDGTPRGSESPKMYSAVGEADGMVSWARLAASLAPAPESA